MSAPVGPPTWMRLMQGPAGTGPVGFDLAMLVLRVGFGGLLAWHGLGKVMNYESLQSSFADPLGIGATNSLNGAIFGELVCGLLVLLGVFTRLASIPAIFTMVVAAFIVGGSDRPTFMPAAGAREGAAVFLIAFVAILLAGPGRFSVDGVLQPKPAEKQP